MIFQDLGIALPAATGIDFLFKAAISVAFVFYIIFAFVIVKQVGKMTDTLELGAEGAIRLLAVLHLLLAIVSFVVAFGIL